MLTSIMAHFIKDLIDKLNIIDVIPGYEKHDDLDRWIKEEEFRNVLNNLCTNKTLGYDGIQYTTAID